MGFLARWWAGGLRADSATPGPADDFWYHPVGAATVAGVRIDADTARGISAWYRGRDILATVLAMLPLPLLERLPSDGGSKPAKSHPLYDILHDTPNNWQDSFQWRRMKMYHLIDYGNAYDRIMPGSRGVVDQLWPIDPRLVTPELMPSGRVVYRVRSPKGGGLTETLTQEEVFHLRGASDNGIVGRGVLEHATGSLGLAVALEHYAAAIFGRGALNSGVIENPGLLDPKASERMAQSFVTAAGNWHLPKVLEQGSKWVPNTATPENAQMLGSRKFTVDEVSRWLGVPRQMLENNDPSFGNAEQFDRSFVAYSLGPWLSLFEFAISHQLILAPQRFFAQFTREALVRGDLTARWNAHVAAVNAGIKSVDEVRAVEDLNARGGKSAELRVPQNIVGKPSPAATPSEPDEDDPEARRADDQLRLRAEAIVTESAARLLRKEVAEVQKLAVRHATDEDAFVEAVTDFYARHAALVMSALQWPESAAMTYCANQAHQVVNADWTSALARWRTPEYAAGVAAMALDEASA
jgi:HK97 family phage portal protein